MAFSEFGSRNVRGRGRGSWCSSRSGQDREHHLVVSVAGVVVGLGLGVVVGAVDMGVVAVCGVRKLTVGIGLHRLFAWHLPADDEMTSRGRGRKEKKGEKRQRYVNQSASLWGEGEGRRGMAGYEDIGELQTRGQCSP